MPTHGRRIVDPIHPPLSRSKMSSDVDDGGDRDDEHEEKKEPDEEEGNLECISTQQPRTINSCDRKKTNIGDIEVEWEHQRFVASPSSVPVVMTVSSEVKEGRRETTRHSGRAEWKILVNGSLSKEQGSSLS